MATDLNAKHLDSDYQTTYEQGMRVSESEDDKT